MLTEAEIDRYAADGYLPGRPLLTAEETAVLPRRLRGRLRPDAGGTARASNPPTG